jgi:DNA-binding IclR family transcriptional regulator
MAGNSSERGRGVISKAVSVLEAFTPNQRELSLNQLAQRTGLPVSTTYRTATELVEWGGLERVEGGGYRIGLRLWEVGELAHRATSMLKIVVPFMQDLYEVTHENIQLAILDGTDALFIEKLFGPRSSQVRSTRGGRLPLHCTGVGKVLLAHAPPHVLDDLLRAGLKRFTPYTLTTPRELTRALSEVRRTGIAFQGQEMDLGLMSVAAPITDEDGTVVAAISVVLRASRYQLRQLAPAVRTAAASASRELAEAGVHGVSAEGMLRLLATERTERTGDPRLGQHGGDPYGDPSNGDPSDQEPRAGVMVDLRDAEYAQESTPPSRPS